jgi:hypothetical protein
MTMSDDTGVKIINQFISSKDKMESKMKKGFLFRCRSIFVPALVLLLLLPCFLWQTVEANTPWQSGGADPAIANTDISISGDVGYLHNLVYPLNTSNNFMQTSGGGEAYVIRYNLNSSTHLFGFSGGGFTPGAFTRTGPLRMSAVDTGSVLRVVASVVLPAQGKYFKLNYLLQNTGSSPITDVKFYEFVEPNANSQNLETTAFDASRNLVYSTNDQGARKYLGVCSTDLTDKHDIGDVDVMQRIASDSLNNAAGPYTGNSWFAFEKDLNTLGPGEQRQFSLFFLAGDSLTGIRSLADSLSPQKVPASSNAGISVMVVGLALLTGLMLLWRGRDRRYQG